MDGEELRNAIVYNLSRRARDLREARVKWESWFAYEYMVEARSILKIFDNLSELCEPTNEYSIEIDMLREDTAPSEEDQEIEKQDILDQCAQHVSAEYEKDKYSGRNAAGFMLALMDKIDPTWKAELRDKI